jgi:beta-glucanase (GH16 family)
MLLADQRGCSGQVVRGAGGTDVGAPRLASRRLREADHHRAAPSNASAAAAAAAAAAPRRRLRAAPAAGGGGWMTLFADHFEGSGVNAAKWGFQLGDGCHLGICGWGNQELQFYTNRSANARVTAGKLVIEAREERGAARGALEADCWADCRARCGAHGGQCLDACGGARCPAVRFSSARLRTYRRFAVAPSARHPVVRVEARISVPRGAGMWPAFWMLPERGARDDCAGCGVYGAWPLSGEIDVMEAANMAEHVAGTVHFGQAWPQNAYLSGRRGLGPGFHVYAVEWEREEIRWYADGALYHSARPAAVAAGGNGWFSAGAASRTAPFDQPFHIILNLAAGGGFTGSPPAESVAASMAKQRKRMVVDYVRVSGRGGVEAA